MIILEQFRSGRCSLGVTLRTKCEKELFASLTSYICNSDA